MALIKDKTYYTYSDVTILPNIMSTIEHRCECIPLDENGMLPLFTAPMNTVVDENNFEKFNEELIYAILPRTVDLETRVKFSKKGRWSAYSLNEFDKVFCDERDKIKTCSKIYALIDVANGHMKKIFDLVRASRNIYGEQIIIMVGNIANPETYQDYAEVGVQYIRVGIGGGNGCLSSSNLGIHAPMASLIDETVGVKKRLESLMSEGKMKYKKLPKIVADGGIRNYSDINKALALGADYVMCGSIFAKMLESSAPKECTGRQFNLEYLSLSDMIDIHKENGKWCGTIKNTNKKISLGDIICTFYGMASKEGQIALNGSKTRTSEGLKKKLKVEYTMHGWVTNFMDYLRSAMSYIGARTLDEFREHSTVIINSTNAVLAVNK